MNEASTGESSGPVPTGRNGTDDSPVEVIYISGKGRSGSTLLCRTLGSVEGFFGAGELMRIFGRGVTNDDLCSCGTPVTRCEVWSEVLDEMGRTAPDFDPDRMERLRDRVTEGVELVPYYFLPGSSADRQEALRSYGRILRALYRAARRVTGCPVVVDSSKNAAYGRILAETPGISLSVVHLVRDARGVSYSLQKRKRRPGTAGRHEHFDIRGPFTGTALWVFAQLMTERLGNRVGRYVRVRYEDFVHAPRRSVESILELLGRSNGKGVLSHVRGRTVELGVHHLIASNPNRSKRGEIELREDLAWREEMGAARRALVTGLTWPLLRRYDYLSREPGGREA